MADLTAHQIIEQNPNAGVKASQMEVPQLAESLNHFVMINLGKGADRSKDPAVWARKRDFSAVVFFRVYALRKAFNEKSGKYKDVNGDPSPDGVIATKSDVDGLIAQHKKRYNTILNSGRGTEVPPDVPALVDTDIAPSDEALAALILPKKK